MLNLELKTKKDDMQRSKIILIVTWCRIPLIFKSDSTDIGIRKIGFVIIAQLQILNNKNERKKSKRNTLKGKGNYESILTFWISTCPISASKRTNGFKNLHELFCMRDNNRGYDSKDDCRGFIRPFAFANIHWMHLVWTVFLWTSLRILSTPERKH